MHKIENDLRCRKRGSTRHFKLEGCFMNGYRVILTFFIIGCLATFLISGVKDVYGAEGISYSPSPVDFGDQGVGGSYPASFTITNTARKDTWLKIVDIPKWAPPERTWLQLESTDCYDKSPLPSKGTCTVTYSFHPYYVGEYSTPVNIRYSFSPYNTVNNLNVQMVGTGIKGTPTITWSNPPNIVYGTPLSGTQLNATASVPGTFMYSPGSGTVLNAGNNQALSVTFTPTDTVNYNTASKTVYINVLKATPTVSAWPTTPSAGITYGQPLSALPLTGGTASVPGSFAFTDPSIVPNAGTPSASVTFTPNDLSNYNTVTGSVTIVVAKATPTITWANPADIVYGTALNGTQLNATASVAGTFAYTPAAGTKLNAGNGQVLSVTFTPTDTTNHNTATKTVMINVLKATPTITWANPADIVYGTALTETQLNATASVPGTFVYTPAAGTVPNAGTQTLHAEFIPEDATNYNTASADVTIKVLKATVTVTWDNPADITHPTPLTAIQLNATASVPGTFVYDPPACTELQPGAHQLSATFNGGPNYENPTVTVTINVLKPYVTKEQVYEKWICTERDAGSGFPIAMYHCPDSECDSCIDVQPRCGNSSLADVEFDVNELRWAGPTNETVDFVTSVTVNNATKSIIYRCIEGIDLVFSCGGGPSWVCKPDAPNLLNTPTVTGKMQQKIGNVWACSESPDPVSGCLTSVYSCSNATDPNPCPCGHPNDPNRTDWALSTFEVVTFNEGELRSVTPCSDDPNCLAVYFATSKVLDNVPNWCIYKVISDSSNCIPSNDPDNPYCVFSYCSPE